MVERDLALSLEATGEQEEAHRIFKRLHEDPDTNGDILAGLVRTAMATGRWEEAIRLAPELEAATSLPAVDRIPLLAEIALREGDPARLEGLVERLRGTLDSPYSLSVLARVLRKIDKRQEARRVLEMGLKHWPYDLDLALALGQSYLEEKRPESTLEVLWPWETRLVPPGPRRHLLELIVEASLRSGQPKRARGALEELLKMFPKEPEIRLIAVEVEMSAGDLDRALTHVEAVLRLSPGNPEAHLLRLEILRRQNRTEEVLAAGKKILRIWPGQREVRTMIAWKLLEADRAEEALHIALPLRGQKPPATRAELRLLAECFRRTKRLQDALATLEALAVRGPETEDLLGLAELRLEAGQADHSLELARQLRVKLPEDPRPVLLEARCLTALGRKEEAVDVLRQALGMKLGEEDRKQVESDLFYTLLEVGRREEARDQGVALLKKRPEDEGLRSSLAFLHLQLGDADRAVETFRPLVAPEKKPSLERRYEFAELLLSAKRRDEAVGVLEAGAVEEPHGGKMQRRLLDLWSGNRAEYGKARGLARAIERGGFPSPEVLESVVRSWHAMGRVDEARRLLAPYWSRPGPRAKWLQRLTVEHQIASGRWKEALATLRRMRWSRGEAWQRGVLTARAYLVAPEALRAPARQVLDSMEASGLVTNVFLAREMGELRSQLSRNSADFGHHGSSDSLHGVDPGVHGTRVVDGRTELGWDVQRVDLERAGVSVGGARVGVRASRITTTGEAFRGWVESAPGVGRAEDLSVRVGYVRGLGPQGDPLEVKVGREYVDESPEAWRRGISADTLRFDYERPREGKAVSTSYSGSYQDTDAGTERWNVSALGVVRPSHRLEVEASLEARDSTGPPDPTDLLFAPRDFQALQLETSWLALPTSWGKWWLRLGRHLDWLDGQRAEGLIQGLRLDLPGLDVSLRLDHFENSANRVQGSGGRFTQTDYRLSWTGRF